MPVKMKALKSFHGDEGSVRRGSEFEAKDGNADAYETQGLAVPVSGRKSDSTRANKADQVAVNKAAEAGAAGGPRGGATGASKPQSSSRQGQARKGRGSRK